MDQINQGQGGFWEENRNLATGVVLASAVAAGVIAYMLRRANEEPPPPAPVATAQQAWGGFREAAGEERVDAARDFFMSRIMPELRPALLALLDDLRDAVDEYFDRAEKSIKRM